jgi:hypothetical protein
MAQNDQTKSRRARRRALRAAQIVTIGFALAGGGCYADHRATPPGEDAAVGDAAIDDDAAFGEDAAIAVAEDAGADVVAVDAAVADTAVADTAVADASTHCSDAEDWAACCNELGWPCSDEAGWGCCAWGPYAPPEEGAVPAPRVLTQRAVA